MSNQNWYRRESDEFVSYIKENIVGILMTSVLILLVWEPWIFDTIPKIDTEVFLNEPYSTYNWLTIGRQGAVLTKKLFGLLWYNAYTETMFGYLTICVAAALFGYLFWRAARINTKFFACIGIVCFTAPIMAEQFYFKLQIFEIGWAYVLCAVAVASGYAAALTKSKWAFAVSVLCMIWCFSTYQIFVVIYVVIAACYYILMCQRKALRDRSDKTDFRVIASLSIGFIIAVIINAIITEIWFSSGDAYLYGQVLWGIEPKERILNSVFSHIKNALVGEKPFFSPCYGLLCGLTVFSLFADWKIYKVNFRLVLYSLAVLGIQIAPFLLTIFFGVQPTIRAQLVYPITLMCDVGILFNRCNKNKMLQMGMFLLTAVLCFNQVSVTQRLIYTDEIRGEEDIRLAEQLDNRICMVTSRNKPIAIVGTYKNRLNSATMRGELIGLSLFNMTSEIEPHYYWSSDRALRVLQTLGFTGQSVNQEQMIEARKFAADMPSWPADGSVREFDDYIVVKLAPDDYYAMDLMEPQASISPLDSQTIVWDESTFGWIDDVSVEDGILTVNGWAIKQGCDSTFAAPQVHIFDENGQMLYTLASGTKVRTDLNTAYSDGTEYGHSGVIARAPVNELPTNIRECKILLSVTVKDKTYFFDATNSISDIEKLYNAIETR